MATESAVTPDRAHPFTAGRDFCLVHNGSLSNPHLVRRKLEPLGIHFETDNDTEAACRFLEWRMREGDSIERPSRRVSTRLDGFFTFLIGTADGLALVRDPFACKPAIVAETDDYVAVASEFRSLAHLPGVAHAKLFEPQPRTIYSLEPRMSTMQKDFDLAPRGRPARAERLAARQHHAVAAAAEGARAAIRMARMPSPAASTRRSRSMCMGHAGYYVAGMNKHAHVTVHGNAGTGAAENMMSRPGAHQGLRLHQRRRLGAWRLPGHRRRCIAALWHLAEGRRHRRRRQRRQLHGVHGAGRPHRDLRRCRRSTGRFALRGGDLRARQGGLAGRRRALRRDDPGRPRPR